MAPEMIFLVKRNNCGLQTWREVVTEVLRTLHDDGPRGDTVAVADVADLQPDEIPSAQLAVDTKVDEISRSAKQREPGVCRAAVTSSRHSDWS